MSTNPIRHSNQRTQIRRRTLFVEIPWSQKYSPLFVGTGSPCQFTIVGGSILLTNIMSFKFSPTTGDNFSRQNSKADSILFEKYGIVFHVAFPTNADYSEQFFDNKSILILKTRNNSVSII